MDISGLRRHLPTQATPKARELAQSMLEGTTLKETYRSSATEQLATVPEPWLERLSQEGMTYVGLGYGEDLSKTDYMPSYTPERLRKEALSAKQIACGVKLEVNTDIDASLASETDEFSKVMLERGRAEEISNKLAAKLLEAGLGFAVKVSRDLTPLGILEAQHNIEDSGIDEFMEPHETDRGLFREILLELNGSEIIKEAGGDAKGYPLADDAVLEAADGVLLVPFEKSGEKRISPVSKASYASINGMSMDQHMGANYWENRLIVVDDGVLELPSRSTGYHSVLLHETGHAMDYVAEGIEGLKHRQTVDALFEKDVARAKNGESPFLTARATDNVREYFAEAVEAYLTQPAGAGDTFYKTENNFMELQARNPDLYAYVDRVMNLPALGETP